MRRQANPVDNSYIACLGVGYDESKLWDEPLNREIFYHLRKARTLIEQWRHFGNTVRLTPAPKTRLPLRPWSL